MSFINEVYFSKSLMEYYNELETHHKHRKWIDEMVGTLKENHLAGDHIRRRLIPPDYKQSVKTLFCYQHPDGYRALYTLTKNTQGTFSITILDFLDHNKYERLF